MVYADVSGFNPASNRALRRREWIAKLTSHQSLLRRRFPGSSTHVLQYIHFSTERRRKQGGGRTQHIGNLHNKLRMKLLGICCCQELSTKIRESLAVKVHRFFRSRCTFHLWSQVSTAPPPPIHRHPSVTQSRHSCPNFCDIMDCCRASKANPTLLHGGQWQ